LRFKLFPHEQESIMGPIRAHLNMRIFRWAARLADRDGTSAADADDRGDTSGTEPLANRSRGAFALPDYVLFTREQTLYAQHLNLKTFQVEGEPQAVAEEVTENESNNRAVFSAPAAGVLVYRAGTFIGKSRFTWRGGDGKLLGTVGEPASIC